MSLLYLANLWKGQTMAGVQCLKGTVTTEHHLKKGQKILVFINQKRNSPTSPDYKLCLVYGKFKGQKPETPAGGESDFNIEESE